MIFFYSGSKSPIGDQYNSDLSLGGWVSKTEIPNSDIANIFGKSTVQDILAKKRQLRLIVIQNTIEGDLMQNSKVYVENTNTDIFSIKLALVRPAYTQEEYPYFEKIKTEYSKPFQAVFSDSEGVDNAIDFGLDEGSRLGIWVMREFKETYLQELKLLNTKLQLTEKEILTLTTSNNLLEEVNFNFNLIIEF